ncbi:hypothetical protein [Micromonospora sp. CA-248212]|uniref:hypothetical protein n=1 Tax=Micromonospora sp. CA-248212 TaxID=3239961 RepID=UPI003D8CE504
MTQLPALLGVLVGTLGTILATTLTDRARWRRSQSTRWDERRLDAYVDYAHALKESYAVALRMTADLRPESHSHPIDREGGLARLAESDAKDHRLGEPVAARRRADGRRRRQLARCGLAGGTARPIHRRSIV